MSRLPGALAALAVLLPALPAGGQPADASSKPAFDEAGPPPRRVFSDDSSFGVLRRVKDNLAKESDFPGKARLQDDFERVYQDIERVPPPERGPLVSRGLDALNPKVKAVLEADIPPEVGKRLSKDMARANVSASQWPEGKDFSDTALAYDPGDRDALISRSNAQHGLRDYPAAWADANQAVKLYPKDAEALRARALASYGLKDYLQAAEDARRALALDPNDRTAFMIMKLAEGRVPALDVAALKSPMGGEIQREYHGMLQQITQVEEKRREPSLQPSPRPAESLVRAAASKIAVKDYWGAIADAGRALAADEANALAYYYRAAAHNLVGRYEEAVRDATRALLLNPSDAGSRDARAWAFNHLGRYRDAMADAHHSLEIRPDNPYAYANLAYSHEHTGDLAAMLRDLRTAAGLNPLFELAYRDAAARHGLEPEPSDDREGRTGAAVTEREEARRKSFLAVVASSVVGGLLIAVGIVSLLSSPRGLEPRAPSRGRGRSAIDQTYSIGAPLGRGGMGVVYEAVDKALQRKVAVKVIGESLRQDPKAKQRFLEEARTVAALHHPCIVDIHSIAEDEAGLYLIFEHIEGRTLDALLRERGRLGLAEAKGILRQVCRALDFAHRHGVVHRDLKPSNIMIAESGDVKVMDFGISRRASSTPAPGAPEAGEAATARGTPSYMAPEAEYGVVRKESDVFSLGACLYEMLTGRAPYPGAAAAPQKASRDYARLSEADPALPRELSELVDWALHPDPDQRLRTPRDFWSLLERVADSAAAARS